MVTISHKGVDSHARRVDTSYMNTTANPASSENWTEKQRQAYEMLKASVAANETRRQVSFSNATPEGGWRDEDQIQR